MRRSPQEASARQVPDWQHAGSKAARQPPHQRQVRGRDAGIADSFFGKSVLNSLSQGCKDLASGIMSSWQNDMSAYMVAASNIHHSSYQSSSHSCSGLSPPAGYIFSWGLHLPKGADSRGLLSPMTAVAESLPLVRQLFSLT